jgi:hypothetical protein
MEIFEFRANPDNRQDADTAVIAPLPFVSTYSNTASRMEATARLSGTDIYAFVRPGADLEQPNPELRQEMSSGNFRQHNDRILNHIGQIAAQYDGVVGMGDSTASYAINALALDESQPFDALLWRDGINLRTLPPGISQAGYFAYHAWEGWKLRDRKLDDVAPHRDDLPADPLPMMLRRTAMEVYHFGPLWRGSMGRLMARCVAMNRPDLPIMHVNVGHTFTGSLQQAAAFQADLEAIRELTDDAGISPAPIVTDVRPDWYHVDLLRPGAAAADIKRTAALI